MNAAPTISKPAPEGGFSLIDADRFRGGMRLVPGAVSIIATSHINQMKGLTATAVSALAADPPSLLVCVNQSASAFEAFVSARRFSVNQLPTHRLDLAKVFSSSAPEDRMRRFSANDWTELATGAPILKDAVVAFDCELAETCNFGTHSILVGRIVGVRTNELAEPLVYLKGTFSEVAPLSTREMPSGAIHAQNHHDLRLGQRPS
jgi:flavin reductase